MGKVPSTFVSTPGASHNPALFYDEQDENGTVRRFFMSHPAGTRKERRSRRRHHPFYTKSRHKGREWWELREAVRAMARKQSEDQGLLNDDSSEGDSNSVEFGAGGGPHHHHPHHP